MSKILTLLFVCTSLHASIQLGKPLREISLNGDDGGRLNGTPWHSKEMLGTPTVLFYVDPDEKNKNETFNETLKKREFPLEKVKFTAIINMAATWAPNFAINSALKSKQEKYPDTLYLKDYKKVLVNKWKLKDDENDVVILDGQGNVRYFFFGKMSQKEIDKAMELIEKIIK